MGLPGPIQQQLFEYLVNGGPPVIGLMVLFLYAVVSGRLRLGREVDREIQARIEAEKERDLARQEAQGLRDRVEQRGSSLQEALALLELVRGRVDFRPEPRDPDPPPRRPRKT